MEQSEGMHYFAWRSVAIAGATSVEAWATQFFPMRHVSRGAAAARLENATEYAFIRDAESFLSAKIL